MDQWEQSPVGTPLGTVAGQLSSLPLTDDTFFLLMTCRTNVTVCLSDCESMSLFVSLEREAQSRPNFWRSARALQGGFQMQWEWV